MESKEHLGIIEISAHWLQRLLQLPDAYRVVGLHINPQAQTIVLTVEHPDLPVTGEWQQLPDVQVMYESVRDEATGETHARFLKTEVHEHPAYTKTEFMKLLS